MKDKKRFGRVVDGVLVVKERESLVRRLGEDHQRERLNRR